jgi:Family of unknown function (DUF5764)
MADITGVYSDARSEYTKQLCNILIPPYFQFFLGILEKAKAEVTKNNEPKKLLWQFQTLLNDIPDWNMEKVNMEIATLQTSCACDYMEDLLTAVFIAHTKVLTAIRVSAKQKKVQITVPKVEHFMFKVLCETSKLLWGNSFLFRDGITSMEKQQNYRNVEGLLAEGIHQAIRAMVPVKNILKDFVSLDGGEEEEEKQEQQEKQEPKVEKQQEQEKPEQQEQQEPEPKVEEQVPEKQEPEKQEPELKVEEKQEPEIQPIILNEISMEQLDISGVKNEVFQEDISAQPVIRIDTGNGPRVGFTHFDTMFDTEIDGNDIIEEPEEEKAMGLEILEEDGQPLDMGDIDDLNGDILEAKDEPIEAGDYDVLL